MDFIGIWGKGRDLTQSNDKRPHTIKNESQQTSQ